MWRRSWSCGGAVLNRAAFVEHAPPQHRVFGLNHLCSPSPSPSPPSAWFLLSRAVSSSSNKLAVDTGNGGGAGDLGGGIGEETISTAEAKKLMRLVNVKSLKEKLGMEGKEVIQYAELLKACQRTGVARSQDEAVAFSRVLDDAGVVLLFRDKVYLHPDKVVDQVKKIVLPPEEDPTIDELMLLQEKKEEIDVLAHKQVRRILWVGLGLSVIQVSLFFRLTFWEFSWDVMEPIAFFTTATGIVIGYAYFMFTSRDPTYQDLMKRLFLSRQRKLIKKMNFDVNRLKELQIRSRTPCDAAASIKKRVGVEVELEDALHKN